MTTTDTTATKIEKLQDLIRDCQIDLESDGYATLAELHAIVAKADEAREELNDFDPDALDEVQSDLDYFYNEWERVTGVEFRATALVDIEADLEAATKAARNILGANRTPADRANELTLADTLRAMSKLHFNQMRAYWRDTPNAYGCHLSHSMTSDFDRRIEFVGDKSITWKWAPEELYEPLPSEWIEIYRDEHDRLVVEHFRLDDSLSTVSYDEFGRELKLESFFHIAHSHHDSECTPLAFIYRRSGDEIGKYHATLRILPLTTNIR